MENSLHIITKLQKTLEQKRILQDHIPLKTKEL